VAERIGVYPGTFDPITLGHADIIRRGAKLVDRLIIGVTTNPSKNPMFTPDERIAIVRREVDAMGLHNIEVVGFNALLMKFAEVQGASVIVRGLRAVADFEYEYQMAGMNQQLNSRIETIFLIHAAHAYPIPSTHRNAALDTIHAYLEPKGIFSRGRFGSWKYEIGNQDHSLMQGVELVDRWLDGSEEKVFRT